MVKKQAQGASTLKLLQMPAETPTRLLSELERDADEIFIEFRRVNKKHPLMGRGGKQQLRFITPRKTEVTLLGNDASS